MQATISVIGAGTCTSETARTADELGRLVAEAGFCLVSGGLGGVMEAASQGARSAGGEVVGLVPGLDRGEANSHVHLSVATGLGHMRNFLVVANADVVVAVEGGWGTLSEIALAKKIGKPVVAIGRWAGLEGIIAAADPAEAIEHVKRELHP